MIYIKLNLWYTNLKLLRTNMTLLYLQILYLLFDLISTFIICKAISFIEVKTNMYVNEIKFKNMMATNVLNFYA